MSRNAGGAAGKPTGPCSLCGCQTAPDWRRIPKSFGEAGGQSTCNACYCFVLKRAKEDEASVPSALEACRAAKRTKAAVQAATASAQAAEAARSQVSVPTTPASCTHGAQLSGDAAGTSAAQAAAAAHPPAAASGDASSSHMLAAAVVLRTPAVRGKGSHTMPSMPASSPVQSMEQSGQQQQQQQPLRLSGMQLRSVQQRQQLLQQQLSQPPQQALQPAQLRQLGTMRMELWSTEPPEPPRLQLPAQPLSPPSSRQAQTAAERAASGSSSELLALQEAAWRLSASRDPAQAAFNAACQLPGSRPELLAVLPMLCLLRPGIGNTPQPAGALLLSVRMPPSSLPADAQHVLLATNAGLQQTLRLLVYCPQTGQLLLRRDWLQCAEGGLYTHPRCQVPAWDSSEGWKLLFPEPDSDTAQAQLLSEIVRRFGSVPASASASDTSFTIPASSGGERRGEASSSSTAHAANEQLWQRPSPQQQLPGWWGQQTASEPLQPQPQPSQEEALPTPFASPLVQQQGQLRNMAYTGPAGGQTMWWPAPAGQLGPGGGQAPGVPLALPPATMNQQQGPIHQPSSTVLSPGSLQQQMQQRQQQFGVLPEKAPVLSPPAAQQAPAGMHPAVVAPLHCMPRPLAWHHQQTGAPVPTALQQQQQQPAAPAPLALPLPPLPPAQMLPQLPQQAQQAQQAHAAFAGRNVSRSGSLFSLPLPLDLSLPGERRASGELLSRWPLEMFDDDLLDWIGSLEPAAPAARWG